MNDGPCSAAVQILKFDIPDNIVCIKVRTVFFYFSRRYTGV